MVEEFMKKALLIYNPLSGNRNVPKKLDYIIERFMEKDILVVPCRIGNDEHNMLPAIIKNADYSFVVISGGDGTINNIVNLLLKEGLDLPIGVIPSGTCNDFARSLNIPNDIKKCMDIILAGNIDEIDAGLLNDDRYFLNTCAGGNLVSVSYSTNTEFKKKFGPLAYYLKALGEVPNLKPVKLKITTDNEVIEQEFLLFLILNGKHAAGFYNIIEEADLSDGYMDILLLCNFPPIELPVLFFKVLENDLISDKNVMWLRTKNCTIEGNSDFPLSIDGEKWNTLPVSIRFINKILKVFVK